MPPDVVYLPADGEPEWWLRVGPAWVVDQVLAPVCCVRERHDAPTCSQPAAYRAAFHLPDAPPGRQDAASHVCAQHGIWTRQRPHLVQLRTI